MLLSGRVIKASANEHGTSSQARAKACPRLAADSSFAFVLGRCGYVFGGDRDLCLVERPLLAPARQMTGAGRRGGLHKTPQAVC
jgi:hypothetical protein